MGLDIATGGLVGRLYDARITNSYNTADICGKVSVGGLVGSFSFSELHCCYSTGYIQGEQYVGGLIGSASATGYKKLTIHHSFAKGRVDGEDKASLAGLANTKARSYLNLLQAYFQKRRRQHGDRYNESLSRFLPRLRQPYVSSVAKGKLVVQKGITAFAQRVYNEG